MTAAIETVDLTGELPSRVQSAAFYAVKDVRRGDKVVLVTAQEPTLLMQSLDLQLRHNLAWTMVEADGKWRIEVSHRADAGPRDVLELLERDHKRLDGLFTQALQLLNRNEAAGAAPLLREFAAALKRHMAVEDDVLAPIFETATGAAGDDPLSIMLREHADIRQQLAVIAECLAGDAPETGEIGAFCAILAGTLAKHEHREENNLFPRWRGRWPQRSAAEREEIMSRVEAALRPGDE